MRRLFGVCAVAVLVALVLGTAGVAKADTFTWSANDWKITNIGNPGNGTSYPNSDYDHLLFAGNSGNWILNPGQTITNVALGLLTFEGGDSCYNCNADSKVATFGLTIDGILHTFSLPIAATISTTKDSVDLASAVFTIVLDGGSALKITTYDTRISVTPNSPTTQATLYGDVMYVTPEPASLLLFGTGLTGLAGFFRKRFAKN